ncbi:origin recognition complex subunit 3 N-terminus-domain-containing protein, partial [Hysterangium stoloniferum]
EFDLINGPLLRFQAYRKAWDKCLGRMKDILRTLQGPLVDEIAQVICNAYVDSPDKIVLPAPELVTILVSSADRSFVHQCLASVVENLSDHQEDLETRSPKAIVSQISETDCSSVINLMKALVSGFISHPLNGQSKLIKISSSSLAHYDIHILVAWYKNIQALYATESRPPALVVMIQDLHYVDPDVLRDVLEIFVIDKRISCNIPDVPLSFLLGSSDANQLHAMVPRSTLSYLRLESFTLASCLKTLEQLIKETFFAISFTPTVMLGPTAINTIFKEFQRQNSTFDALLSTLQLLHMQHFYSPLSILNDAEYDAMLFETIHGLSGWKPFMKLLRQQHLSGLMNNSDWQELSPQDVLQKSIQVRSTFQNRISGLKVGLHVLNTARNFAQACGVKMPDVSFREIFVEALQGTLGTTVTQTCTALRGLHLIQAGALLEELYRFLQHELPRTARTYGTALKEQIVLAQNDLTAEQVQSLLDFLKGYFENTFSPLDDIPCLDVWWTGESNITNLLLNPNPHISIVSSLLEPQEYFGWLDPHKLQDNRSISSLPDASILFHRCIESGKMINLYDWYQSFILALEDVHSDEEDAMDVEDSPSKGKGKEKRKAKRNGNPSEWTRNKKLDKAKEDENRREVQARFMRSMHELEFVGFLKHTGRKIDHVLKAVFDLAD